MVLVLVFLVELFSDLLPGVGGAFPGGPGAFDGAQGFSEHSLGFFADSRDLETLALRLGSLCEFTSVGRNDVPVFDERVAMLTVLEERGLSSAQLFVLLAERFVRVYELGASGRQVVSVGHFRPSIATGWYTLAPPSSTLSCASRCSPSPL